MNQKIDFKLNFNYKDLKKYNNKEEALKENDKKIQ